MADLTGIDLARVRALEQAENARFVAERPRSMALQARARDSMPRGVPMAWMDDLYEHPPVWVAHGEGSRFTDVDGHTYLDMYVADMSAFCGHAPEPVVEAVARRMGQGNQFLLPGEDAVAVAEHLAGRYGLPKWQFTLSATQANTEVIRLARELTGREIVLMFDAKYHGEGDATLVIQDGGRVVAESRRVAVRERPVHGRRARRPRRRPHRGGLRSDRRARRVGVGVVARPHRVGRPQARGR
jgi:glutamate-1-semialdehyde 2,1-aminomutase